MSIFNGIINGTKFGIYDGSTLIAYATSGSMTINHSLRESSNKESMGWKEQLEGQRDWEMSLEGVVAFLGAGASAGAGSAISNKTFDEIFSGYIFDGSSGTGSDGRNIISIKFSTEETGDFKEFGCTKRRYLYVFDVN